ncbi:MAG TPA: hypothetical protein VHY84_23310 [Bryobacteraceae bacterium]|nr:hypothetical protein [Bryobacteraceae bacterium]
MTRTLYASLLRLHPQAFRRQFAPEMLWIFDEAHVSEGAWILLFDLLASLCRQWLLRTGFWKVTAAIIGAALQMLPALNVFARSRSLSIRPMAETPVEAQGFAVIVMCMISLVILLVVSTVLWATRVSRLKALANRRSRCRLNSAA